jgi:hypothetical protein
VPRRRRGGRRIGELDLQPLDRDPAQVLQRVHHDEPSLAQDGQPVGDPLHLRQRVRGEEDRATLGAALGQQRVEALLHQRVQPGDGLVEDEQLRIVHEGLDEAQLLPVAGRQLADGPVQVGAEALGQRVAAPAIDPAAQLAQVVEDHRARQLRIQAEVTGEVADAAADLQGVGVRVETQQRCGARGGADEVQQQPHRGRLPGAVGAQEAEHLTALHLEVQLEEAPSGAEVLREPVGGDGGAVGHGSHDGTLATWPRT